MYAQALLYQIFYKHITFTKPAYFSMVYYHITFHDLMYMALVKFTPLKFKHLPYCYYSQKVEILDNEVYCNLSLSLSHTHTQFSKHIWHRLMMLTNTTMQVPFLPLMHAHVCVCVYKVLFSLKVVFF